MENRKIMVIVSENACKNMLYSLQINTKPCFEVFVLSIICSIGECRFWVSIEAFSQCYWLRCTALLEAFSGVHIRDLTQKRTGG